jgi:hypothetical protein
MAKPPKKGLDALKIFLHAGRFHKSFELLLDSVKPQDGGKTLDQDIGIVSHPAMVLSVFASELYLKCLLCLEKDEVPDTHNLKLLSEKLEVKTRHDIDDLWDTDIRSPGKQTILEKVRSLPRGKELRTDLRYAIDVGANSFIDLRYFYEKERTNFLLQDFPYVLRAAITKRMPPWKEVLPPPSIDLFR